jgi:hypothetical protein
MQFEGKFSAGTDSLPWAEISAQDSCTETVIYLLMKGYRGSAVN